MLIREKLPTMQQFIKYNKAFVIDEKAKVVSATIASPKLLRVSPTLRVWSHSPFLKHYSAKGDLFKADLDKYLPKKVPKSFEIKEETHPESI